MIEDAIWTEWTDLIRSILFSEFGPVHSACRQQRKPHGQVGLRRLILQAMIQTGSATFETCLRWHATRACHFSCSFVGCLRTSMQPTHNIVLRGQDHAPDKAGASSRVSRVVCRAHQCQFVDGTNHSRSLFTSLRKADAAAVSFGRCQVGD